MTGPAHSVETSYEPHRNLITGVVNRAGKVNGDRLAVNGGTEAGAPGTSVPAADSGPSTKHDGPSTISSYVYANDLLGRRETISQGGEAFGMLALGENRVEVAYNDRSEVVGSVTRRGDIPVARHTYAWNADNNLIRVEAKDDSLRLDYLYDHQSRRTVRIETTNRGKDNESRRTTYYLYDEWNLLAELESSAGSGASEFGLRVSSFLTWGRDLSGSLQGAGGVGGLLAISRGEEHRYPTYDANGNIGQLIDNDGAIVASYAYDPFGNVTEMAGAEAAENPWRFSTKPVEAVTGWLYYGYRWYDAGMGRWVNRDPIEESGGVNLYGFVGNDGVGSVDRLGLNFVDCLRCGTAIVAATAGVTATAIAIAAAATCTGATAVSIGTGSPITVPCALVAAAAAAGSLVGAILAIDEASTTCPKCCGHDEKDEIEDLRDQIRDLQEQIEDLRNNTRYEF